MGICSSESLSNISSGIYGGTCVNSPASDGVRGYSLLGAGVRGESIAGFGNASIGVLGIAGANPPVRPINTGVYAYASAQDATGVYGRADGLNAVAVKGVAPSAQEYAGRFFGKVEVNGPFTYPSDIRLKHDVRPLAYGLDALAALKPVSYVMNDDTSSSQRLGLIAQDVRSVIPEIVHGDGDQEMLSINYLDLIPVLIRGIQEQQAQIEALTARPVDGGPPDDAASSANAATAPWSADGIALAFGLPVVLFGGLALVRRRRHAGFTLMR